MATLIRPLQNFPFLLGFAVLVSGGLLGAASASPLIRTPLSDGDSPGNSPDSSDFDAEPSPIRAFLDAPNLRELGLSQNQLVDHARGLMNRILDQDPQLAPRIVLQLDRLIRHEQKTEGWQGGGHGNGWSAAGGFVRDLVQDADPVDAAGFVCRIFRADVEGRIPAAGWDDWEKIGLPLWHRFNAYGGNFDTAAALTSLSRVLRTRTGEGSTVFLFPALCKFAQQLRPAQIEAARDWAEELVSSPVAEADPEIARQLLLAIRFLDVLAPEPRDSAVFANLREILNDEKLSLPWRLSLAHFCSEVGRHRLPADLALDCGRLAARLLESGGPGSGENLAFAIAAFQRHPDHPAWTGLAQRISTAWVRRNRDNDKPAETGLPFDPCEELILTMIDLNYQAGSRAAARRVLQGLEDTAPVWAGAYILMVENDDFFLATQLLKKHAKSDAYHYQNYPIDIRVNAHLEAAIPRYLATLENEPDLRAFAEVWLATGRDPPRYGPGAIPDLPSEILDDRLARVAIGFAAAPPKDEDFLRRSLECLSITKRPIPDLHPMLEKRRAMLKSILENGVSGTGAYWATHVASRIAIGDFMERRPEPLREFWDEVTGEDHPFARYRAHAAEAIIDQTGDIARIFAADGRIADLESMLPLMRDILATTPDGTWLPDYARTASRICIAHARAGQPEVFRAWFETQPEEIQQLLVRGLTENQKMLGDLLDVVNPGRIPAEDLDPNLRREVIAGVLGQPFIGRSHAGQPLLARLAKSGGLTPEDLADLAPRIAELAPRAGTAYTEWVGLMKEKGQASRALGVLEIALERLRGRGALVAMLSLEKAFLFEHLDRRADALELVDSLPDEVGEGTMRQAYASSLRILRMRLWDWSLSGKLEN